MTLQTVRVKSSRMRRRRRVPTRSSCRKRTQCDRVLKEPKDEHQNQSSSGHRGTEVWRGRAAHLCVLAAQPGESSVLGWANNNGICNVVGICLVL